MKKKINLKEYEYIFSDISTAAQVRASRHMGLNYQPFKPNTSVVKNSKYSMDIFLSNVWPKISSVFCSNSAVLDIGCGTGRHSKFFSKHVKHVIAMDKADPKCGEEGYDYRLLSDLTNVALINEDFMEVTFTKQAKFDVVFIHGAFYFFYICYGDLAVEKILSFMTPKKTFLVMVEGVSHRPYDLSYITKKYNLKESLNEEIPWGKNGGRITIHQLN